jgi:hypothetical protein
MYLTGRADNDISLLEETQVSTGFSRQTNNLLASLQLRELGMPLLQPRINHLLIWLDTNRVRLLVFTPEPQKREFGTDSFPLPVGALMKMFLSDV